MKKIIGKIAVVSVYVVSFAIMGGFMLMEHETNKRMKEMGGYERYHEELKKIAEKKAKMIKKEQES